MGDTLLIIAFGLLVGFGSAAIVFRHSRSVSQVPASVLPEYSAATALDSSSDATMALWLGDGKGETLEEFALRKGAEVDREQRAAAEKAEREGEAARLAYEARSVAIYFEALTEDHERTELRRKAAHLLTPEALAEAKRADEARQQRVVDIVQRSSLGSGPALSSGSVSWGMQIPRGSNWVALGE